MPRIASQEEKAIDRLIRNGGNGYALSRDLTPRLIPVAGCKPLGRETRKHPPQQVRKLAASLERFGFVLPIVTDAEGRVVAGWGLVLAARRLGLSEVPALSLTDLSEAELRALRLALNRISDDARWDRQALILEFSDILQLEPQIELEISGFEMGEIEVLLEGSGIDQEDEFAPVEAAATPVTRIGDVWVLGDHRLHCGDALRAESYARVLRNDKADMLFADPPYKVSFEGSVSGLGKIKHAGFAKGRLSPAEFEAFLHTALGHAASRSINGAVHFVCTHWRRLREVLAVGHEVYSELLDLCVWNKINAEVGSAYGSHELILVYKLGRERHINHAALGPYGRQRSNVWDYAAQNVLSGSTKGKPSLQPTVQPVAMIADAIRDCSNRGGLILDPFGGAGTTLIAAERTGRRARVIELNPLLVDLSIERWQRLTGEPAVHAETGHPFARDGTESATDRSK